ncbi:MAG: ABC transporter permease [Parabacteroides sp.]|nr:ABC transporter permease [Parabacteroides sp.]
MYKIYFKQALQLLKENPFLGILTIVGTVLAICMIMIIVIVYEVRTANYKPETRRDRMLSVKWGTAKPKKEGGDWSSNSRLSTRSIKECFYPLESAEAVTGILHFTNLLATVPGSTEGFKADVTYTDAAFWRVFEFNFLEGQPYVQEEFESGIRKVVISETIARRLYGTKEVVGKTVELGFVPYTIGGVVKDVPMQAEAAYGNVWAPYTTTPLSEDGWAEDLLGSMRCYILAPSSADFDAIRREVNQRVEMMNGTLSDLCLDLRGQPDTQFAQLSRRWAGDESDASALIRKYVIIILVLLLVPAFNLSGITLSRMKKRMAELGVRKAFGASQKELFGQILYENFIFTLIGGAVGLALSYFAVVMMKDWLLFTTIQSLSSGTDTTSMKMLFKPMVFVYAFLFCLLINLVSAGIPAWIASRKNIVSSLNQQ